MSGDSQPPANAMGTSQVSPSNPVSVLYTWRDANLDIRRVALCDPTQEGHQCRFVVGLTSIKSALHDGSEWCLDGGEAIGERQSVTISKVSITICYMLAVPSSPNGNFVIY